MKVVATLLMLVGLCSCTQVPAGTPNIETNQNVVFTGKNGAMFTTEFTYKNHSYIWFHYKSGGWDGNDGIVHSPDCHCNKK